MCANMCVSNEDTDEKSNEEYGFESDGEGVFEGNIEDEIQKLICLLNIFFVCFHLIIVF